MVRRLAIVGTGLIGASVGLAAREAGVDEVRGWDLDPDALHVATDRGAVEPAASLSEAVADAELAVVAAPVASLPTEVAAVLEASGNGTTVTDVGSTKGAITSTVTDARFIGGHPVCGSEARGPAHANGGIVPVSSRASRRRLARRGSTSRTSSCATCPASAAAR